MFRSWSLSTPPENKNKELMCINTVHAVREANHVNELNCQHNVPLNVSRQTVHLTVREQINIRSAASGCGLKGHNTAGSCDSHNPGSVFLCLFTVLYDFSFTKNSHCLTIILIAFFFSFLKATPSRL